MTEPYPTNPQSESSESDMERLSARDIFAAADQLFNGIDYGEESYSQGEIGFRSISGVLNDKHNLPLIPIKIVDRLNEDSKRIIHVSVLYLLTDGSRPDQSVEYSLEEGDDLPTVNQRVYFGDNWGTDIPLEPFSDKPEASLVVMQKALETVRRNRLQTPDEYRDLVWHIN